MEFLRETYLPRLTRALEVLPEADLWWRPHEGAISMGTTPPAPGGKRAPVDRLGHRRRADERDRAAEFAATAASAEALGSDGPTLLARLAEALDEACQVIAGLDEQDLLCTHRIQGEEVSGLYAVYHVVEHFSWHTGQALMIAKTRGGARGTELHSTMRTG